MTDIAVTANIHPFLQNQLENYQIIKKKIETLSKKIVSLFAKIASILPEIDSEINEQIKETNVIMDYFLGFKEFDKKGLFSYVIDDINVYFNNLKKSIDSIQNTDQNMFDKLLSQLNGIESIRDLVKNINTIAIDIEYYSYNILFLSTHYSQDQNAFYVISDQIKTLSNSIKNNYNILKELNLVIQNNFNEIKEKQNEIKDENINLHQEIEEKVKMKLDNFIDECMAQWKIFKEDTNCITEVKEIIIDIMNKIQLQDIINQSFDHIKITYEEAIKDIYSLERDKSDNNLPFDKEEYAYILECPGFLIKLLENILKYIKNSTVELDNYFIRVNEMLAELSDEKKALTRYFLGNINQSDQGSFIDKSFSTIENLLLNLKNKSCQIFDYKKNIIFQKYLSEISEQIETFISPVNAIKSEISTFNFISFLMKLEITKKFNTNQVNKDAYIKDLDKIYQTIYKSIKNSHTLCRELIHKSENMNDTFKKNMEYQKKVISTIENDVNKISKSLHDSKKQIKEIINYYKTIFNPLRNLMTTVKEEIKRIYLELESFQEIFTMLKSMQKDINGEHKADSGTSKVSKEKLNKILDRFTMLEHKSLFQEDSENMETQAEQESNIILF